MKKRAIRIECKGAAAIPYDKLNEFQGNLKDLSRDAYAQLRKEITETGFAFPIAIWMNPKNKKPYIINGHQRLRTVKELVEKEGWTCPPLPVTIVTARTMKEAKRRVLQGTSQYGEMTGQGLYEFMHGAGIPWNDIKGSFRFPEINMDKFHVEFFAKDGGGEEGDEVPEAPKKPRTKRGDLYLLGDHRLICGDATEKEDVDCLMDGEKADMVFTDPPYGISVFTKRKVLAKNKIPDGRKRQGNDFDPVIGDDEEFNPSFLLESFQDVKEIFLWGANYYIKGSPGHSWICWDKKGSESADQSLIGDFELCWSKNKHKNTMIRHVWHGPFGHNRSVDGENKMHPTQKPVGLAEKFFEKWGKNLTNIIDLYGGSGSTLIACEKTDRRCFMMEIDQAYCDVIVKRWEEFTGKKAELVRKKQTIRRARKTD